MAQSVIVGGSSGLGRFMAQRFADRGHEAVITSRDATRAGAVAEEIGANATGIGLDMTRPETIADALADISEVDGLVITAIEQAVNALRDFDLEQAIRSVTVKLVGYPEVVRVLCPRFTASASVVLFGGVAKDRPYPGSTMVTTFNGGVSALIKTLAVEIAPHRVNAIHPGIVGDSPKWRDDPEHPHLARTPIGRLVTMDEVADATDFLLRNGGVNAHDLVLDGGVLVS